MKGGKLMDQIKIGKFISEKRKEIGITQSELAEKLNITDRAISKWENGVCMPDVGTIPELCEILNITINDLFSGEVVNMKNNEKKLEENLMEMARQKEEADKRLLNLEWIIGILACIVLLGGLLVASYVEMETYLRVIIIVGSVIVFLIAIFYALKIEQVAGYYECKNCGHKYVPEYWTVFFAPHMGRSRYMRCPQCNTKCYHKKVIK
jgi:transcriptional regulator with XRE-family HTH domain